MNPAIDSAQLSFYLHATEDEEKVLKALGEMLKIDRERLERRRLEGHFGNVIISYTARLRGDEAAELWSRVIDGMNSLDRDELRRSLEERLEDNLRLHLRLDKQALVLGKIRLAESDPVKLEFRFARKVADVKEVLEGLV
ncbi:MAG: RNA-binding domain-containing protein [Conexivisphaerales archaeon]